MQLACLAEFKSGIILKPFSAQGLDVVIDTNPRIEMTSMLTTGG